MRKKIADRPPLLDCPTQTAIIKVGNAVYLVRERSDTGAAIEVVGKWIRGSNRQDTLKPDKDNGEFVHKHEAGYFYLLGRVDAEVAGRIIEERNASR
jgi:hypothetical protein